MATTIKMETNWRVKSTEAWSVRGTYELVAIRIEVNEMKNYKLEVLAFYRTQRNLVRHV